VRDDIRLPSSRASRPPSPWQGVPVWQATTAQRSRTLGCCGSADPLGSGGGPAASMQSVA
jgi:hypothetical protein